MERFHTREDFLSDPRYRAPVSDCPLPSQKPVRPRPSSPLLCMCAKPLVGMQSANSPGAGAV